MITADSIYTFAPRAHAGYVAALTIGADEIKAAGITTPLIWSHFISQLAHESRGLTFTREDTRWSGARMKQLWPGRFPLGALDPRIAACRGDPQKLANLAYASVAGNEGGDDGWDYRGGGLIQLTGRANYRACGQAIGVNLEDQPDLIEEPEIALKAALWFWRKHDLNRFAAHNYGRAVGNGINRGNPYASKDPIGYADREQWFRRAWASWGEGELPAPTELRLGAYGDQVERVQRRLKELGYAVGAVDRVLGPATARALAGFKLDRRRAGVDMEPEERVGALTLAALDQADRAPLSPDRRGATVATLAELGSTGVATGQRAKAAGQAVLYTAAAGGAAQLGVLDGLNSLLSGINVFHLAAVPAIDAAKWALSNWLWVGGIVAGGWLWLRGNDVIMARLKAHQSGENLGR